jgi:8-oxo-dGTP diphosphatase
MPASATPSLPRHYAITGAADSEEAWWQHFERLLALPDALIQLRLRPGQHAAPAALLAEAVRRARARGQRILVNGPPALAQSTGADGVHLTAHRLLACEQRPLQPPLLVGASCHDEAELRHAERIGVDFVCLSPLYPTPSHPGVAALGLARFKELVAASSVPVYALGGVGPADLAAVRAAGAYGVAGISAFWGC